MKMKVRFLSRKEPMEWEMEGRKGKTYRIGIMTEEGGDAGTLKVSEAFYMSVLENGLSFGDVVNVVFVPRFVLNVVNGRAVQELKIIPDSFEFVATNAAAEAAD